MMNKKITYKNSGVDINTGNDLVTRIKPFASATRRIGSMESLGGFGALFDLKKCGYNDPILVSATDGVGTKLKIAHQMGIHNYIGYDLVAMCVNDLIVQGAEPLFFLDYYACSKLDNNVAAMVIESIASACKESGCALVGGETAEMPDMYESGEYDLAGFAVGAVERTSILPKNNIQKGDIILGLESSGVHSNGYSLIRKIISEYKLNYNDPCEFNHKISLGDALLFPTKIYVKPCLEIIKQDLCKALCHITGGGFTENLPRILPENLKADIDYSSWELPDIFKWVQNKANLSDDEMHKTFNCGIGMVVICSPDNEEVIKESLLRNNINNFTIGKVV